MTGKIFISYRRRDDPGGAGRLFDALNEAFEPDRLFLDVDSIEPGQDFGDVIEDRIAKSAVLLAVIGQHWVDASDDRGNRRLDDPQDYVRMEIETAMKQDKRVIPVLIGDAKMPGADVLPESIRKFARHNAVMLRYERFHDDIANLVGALKRAMGDAPAPMPASQQQAPPVAVFAAASLPEASAPPRDFLHARAPLVACAIAFVALALAGATFLKLRNHGLPTDGKSPVASTSQPGWCQDPNLRPEELRVCASHALLALDDRLGEFYAGVKKRLSSEQGQALSADEKKWLNETRHACAQDEPCLTKVYQERIAYLKNFPAQQ
jgi:hypothetical protein